jgi:uncharacterized repeat protein (TIGR01451 family)
MATTAFVTKNGDIIRWEIPVTNNGAQADTNVTVTGAYPAGVLYTTHNPVSGTTFDTSTPEWVIPSLASGATKTLVVFTKVTDITLAPFVWNLTVDGDNTDPTAGNNTLTLTVETTTCPPSAGAVDDPSACLCGNVTDNDTLCSNGTTEIRIGTTTNLDEDFTIGTDGSYNASGFILDPFAVATFTYSIWCIVGEDEFETSGPATVTIPALFHPDAPIGYNLFGDLTEYDSMEDAVAGEGPGMPFLASLTNTEGWPYRGVFVTPLS